MSRDQRQFTRYDSQLFISYSVLNDMGSPVFGGMALAKNISRGGVLLESRNPVASGSRLELILAVGEETLKVRGEVRHVEQKDDKYEIGTYLINLTDNEIKLIKAHYPEFS